LFKDFLSLHLAKSGGSRLQIPLSCVTGQQVVRIVMTEVIRVLTRTQQREKKNELPPFVVFSPSGTCIVFNLEDNRVYCKKGSSRWLP